MRLAAQAVGVGILYAHTHAAQAVGVGILYRRALSDYDYCDDYDWHSSM
jgi:hypothetical protein